MSDKIIKLLAYKGKISIMCADTTQLVEKARTIHDLSPVVTAGFGRMLTMSAMMGAEMKNKKEMLRVLKTPENVVVLDDTGRKNGRGAYLCFQKECLEKAEKNKGIERSLKMPISPDVYESLKKEFDKLEFVENTDL